MKKIYFLFIVIFITTILMSSCGKQGATGPAGTTGSQGAVGPAGPAGANGQNGSVIYSGNGAPALTMGAVGDYYIDFSAGLLYGPKTAASWGTGFSLIGATGSTGAAGSQIYSGSGAPAVSLGVAGDYYLDVINYLLYGPKTSTDWGTPISLQGPEGNANVKTDVFSIGGTDWLWNSEYLYETSSASYTEYFTRYYVRNNTSITQDVLDNGLVMVYFTPSPTYHPDQWEPLAYQFDSSFGYTFSYVYVTSPGVVTLHYFFIQTDASATLPTLSSYNDEVREFKIVAISGTALSYIKSHHINVNDYTAVSKITGIWQKDKN